MRTYFPLKEAVSGYMDNVKTIEAMKADMSRIDTLREAVKTDGIAAPMTESNLENIRDAEGKIMDKAKADNKAKRSMSLDVSFGTAKSHSLSEERTIQAEGSTLHAKDTLTVKSGEDMTVKGSQMSAEEVYLKAGKDIRILSVENSSTAREKENASSASLGGSIGSSGLNGIRASYGRGRKEGKSEEISHTESTIKADYTLSLESGRDTILKGSRIEGEKVQADAGGSLSMESEQDRKTYRENGKNPGISLGYDIPSGKASGFALAGKSHTNSHYESVINQAGIYAGDKGFDITVKDNTHLKGAVIDSKGDAEKNTLRTGTLSWEDIENKADYTSGGSGISYTAKLGGNVNNDTQSSRENSRYNKEPGTNAHNESDKVTRAGDGNRIPLNERGLLGVPSAATKGKADSTTRAAMAPGKIVITDTKNQKQDVTGLDRNTRDSLNKLKVIFDKTRAEERKQLVEEMSLVKVLHLDIALDRF